jgi:hypothetical protein
LNTRNFKESRESREKNMEKLAWGGDLLERQG